MQISHFSSGALVGRLSPNPVVAFTVGVAAHFAIDKIPHFWPESDRARLIFTVIDYALGAIMIAILLFASESSRTNILWGFLGSASVDLLLVGIPFLHKTKLGQWHTNRQPHRTKPAYLATDLVLTFACVVLIRVI